LVFLFLVTLGGDGCFRRILPKIDCISVAHVITHQNQLLCRDIENDISRSKYALTEKTVLIPR